MGERIQVSAESQPEQRTQNLSNPITYDPSSASTSTVELTVASAPHPPPPPAKITPSRPRKIRKVSHESELPIVASGEGVSIHTTDTPKPVTARKHSKSTSSSQGRGRIVQSPVVQVKPMRVIPLSLSCDGEVETAICHLRMADPHIASLIALYPPPSFDTFHTPFLALTRSILYQQLAFKAGASIYTRFISLCGGEGGVLPENVLSLTPQQLRQIGVSGRKASYLHDLARKYQNAILSDSAIVNMDDKSLFTMLTMVNGIGSWSVHMFMIFSLHRPDVLPINDLGVRKGVQLLYNLDELPRPSQMEQLCEKWKPYRSVAAWYLWRFVETKGSSSSAVAVASGAGMMQSVQQQVEDETEQHQQAQVQAQAQLLDPINSILNLGYEY